nr:hypothetical protein [uncultured Cupriavidus sp.]
MKNKSMLMGVMLIVVCVVGAMLLEKRVFRNPISDNDDSHYDAEGNAIIPFGDAVMRIRPTIKFAYTKSTSSEIARLEFIFNFSRYFSVPPTTPSTYDALVKLHLMGSGKEDPVRWDSILEADKWTKITHRPDLGLTEYERAPPADQGWGALTYVADAKEKTPRGSLIIFRCTRVFKAREPGICQTAWQHQYGPMVEYFQSGELLGHWNEIRMEVEEFVNSTMVKKNGYTSK